MTSNRKLLDAAIFITGQRRRLLSPADHNMQLKTQIEQNSICLKIHSYCI